MSEKSSLRYWQMVYDNRISVVPIGMWLNIILVSEEDLSHLDLKSQDIPVVYEQLDPKTAAKELKDIAEQAKINLATIRKEWGDKKPKIINSWTSKPGKFIRND